MTLMGFFIPSPIVFSQVDIKKNIKNQSEIKDIVSKPALQEKIPGLDFLKETEIPVVDCKGGKCLIIPYLGQYISAVYKWSIAAAGILAVIVIIVSAIQWMFPALNLFTEGEGDQKRTINKAKKRILRSLGGLVIAVGSYTLLYTINPELVEFDALQIKYIEKKIIEDAPTAPGATPLKDINCDSPPKQPPEGAPSPDETVTYNCSGDLAGKDATTIKDMKKPLCDVAAAAKEKGYKLKIVSSYRSFKSQVKLWCDKIKEVKKTCNKESPPKKCKKTSIEEIADNSVARPGGSIHQSGRAVDVQLLKLKNGNAITECCDTDAQCSTKKENIKTLANLFYNTNDEFVRYEAEIWHFEYGTKSKDGRGQSTTYPRRCEK